MIVGAGEAGLVDELAGLIGVHNEAEHLGDGGAGDVKDNVVAIAAAELG